MTGQSFSRFAGDKIWGGQHTQGQHCYSKRSQLVRGMFCQEHCGIQQRQMAGPAPREE